MKKESLSESEEIGPRIKLIRNVVGLTQAEMAEKIALSASQYSKVEIGNRNLGRSALRLLSERFGVDEKWILTGEGRTPTAANMLRPDTPAQQQHPVANATPISMPIQLVKVYGFAQALGCRIHKGDLIPENEFDLPTIPVVADGRTYVAFKVEGDSMAPRIADGMIALADVKAELVNKCIVICKWDDTVTIKRYRRMKDTILLTSDNSAAGQDYEVHARDVDWCLRVVKVSAEV